MLRAKVFSIKMYAEKYAETKYVSLNLHNHGIQLWEAANYSMLALEQYSPSFANPVCPLLTYDRPEGGKRNSTVGEVCCSLVLTCKLNLANHLRVPSPKLLSKPHPPTRRCFFRHRIQAYHAQNGFLNFLFVLAAYVKYLSEVYFINFSISISLG